MSMLLLLALAQTRQLITVNLPSGNWTPPTGVVRLENLVGKGADGTAGEPGYYGPAPQMEFISRYYRRRDGGPDDTTFDEVPTSWTGPTPSGSSTTESTPDSTVYYEVTTITSYGYGDAPYYPGTAGTVGASSTAFGKTFPGGNQAPATSSSYQLVPLTPGTSYPISVAAGGFITISYYQ